MGLEGKHADCKIEFISIVLYKNCLLYNNTNICNALGVSKLGAGHLGRN